MKLGCVFALVLAIAAVAPVRAAPLGEGAYRSGDYLRAVKRIGPAAERGDARAQAYLGFMYQYGRGVPQNYASEDLKADRETLRRTLGVVKP